VAVGLVSGLMPAIVIVTSAAVAQSNFYRDAT
jgi:hypothetical protein